MPDPSSQPVPQPAGIVPPEVSEFSIRLVVLRRELGDFKWLFAESDPRFKLVMDASQRFFTELLHLQLDSLVLGISRLTDPPTTGAGKKQRQNLTLKAIHELCSSVPGYPTADYDAAAAAADAARNHAELWRHKRIAHLDLPLALTRAYGTVTPAELEKFVEKACDYVVALHGAYGVAFQPRDPRGGVVEIVTLVKRAMALEAAPDLEPIAPAELIRRADQLGE